MPPDEVTTSTPLLHAVPLATNTQPTRSSQSLCAVHQVLHYDGASSGTGDQARGQHPGDQERGQHPGDQARGQHPGDQARCQHPGDQERGQHPGDQARGQHPGDQARGQHPGDQARGQHPGDQARGQHPGDQAKGQHPGDQARGQHPGDQARGQHPGDQARGQHPGDQARGQHPGDQARGQHPGDQARGQHPGSCLQTRTESDITLQSNATTAQVGLSSGHSEDTRLTRCSNIAEGCSTSTTELVGRSAEVEHVSQIDTAVMSASDTHFTMSLSDVIEQVLMDSGSVTACVTQQAACDVDEVVGSTGAEQHSKHESKPDVHCSGATSSNEPTTSATDAAWGQRSHSEDAMQGSTSTVTLHDSESVNSSPSVLMRSQSEPCRPYEMSKCRSSFVDEMEAKEYLEKQLYGDVNDVFLSRAGSDTPANTGPGSDTPTNTGPGSDTPTNTGPGSDTPANTGPGSDTPANTGPFVRKLQQNILSYMPSSNVQDAVTSWTKTVVSNIRTSIDRFTSTDATSELDGQAIDDTKEDAEPNTLQVKSSPVVCPRYHLYYNSP